MFGSLGSLFSLVTQAGTIGPKLQELGERLRAERVSASVAGGMVSVEMNGLGELLQLKIDPKLLVDGKGEMIEDLVPAAVNQGAMKAKEVHARALREMAEGMNVPGLADMMQNLGGNGLG